jgi:hypothetical protein
LDLKDPVVVVPVAVVVLVVAAVARTAFETCPAHREKASKQAFGSSRPMAKTGLRNQDS